MAGRKPMLESTSLISLRILGAEFGMRSISTSLLPKRSLTQSMLSFRQFALHTDSSSSSTFLSRST